MTASISISAQRTTTAVAVLDITVDPPKPKTLTVTVAIGAKTVVFDEAHGTPMNDYVDPQGRFTMSCVRVTDLSVPDFMVDFRRDKTGAQAGREEVVFWYGSIFRIAYPAMPVEMGAYPATISKGTDTLAVFSVPVHHWRSRWRWQSVPRIETVSVASLIHDGLIPPYDKAVVGNFTPAPIAHAYTPMSLVGLTPYMPTTGDRNEIGLITEPQAHWVCMGDSAMHDLMMAQAEASGTLPWHFMDERTGAPLDVNAYPNATAYAPGGANPYLSKTNSGIVPDPAHEPSLCYLPFLLTGDPYYLEAMQYQATFNIVQSPYNSRASWNMGTAVRGYAWSLRSLVQAEICTPLSVPSWLKPRGYFTTLLNTCRNWTISTFVNSTAQPNPTLHLMSNGGNSPPSGNIHANMDVQTFMEEFALAVFAWVVLTGHTEWQPVLAWKAQCTIARTNGTSGWLRAWPCPYSLVIRDELQAYVAPVTAPNPNDPAHPIVVDPGKPQVLGPYAPDWAACWTLNMKWQSYAYTDPNRMPDGSDLTYPSYVMGALGLAAKAGITEAKPCYDWIKGEISRTTNATHYIAYKWGVSA